MKNNIAMVSNEILRPKEEVGCRIESGGYFGTVRYIGKLPDYPGIWYGIEWDDPTRGKHNGTVNGVQYFQTKHLTSGSFVRREKINFGRSLIEAIIVRYSGQESDLMKRIHEQQLISLQKSIKAPFIEFVGFEKVSTKQSNFEALGIVSVRLQNVSFIGEPNELGRLCPNIREIDISRNLFTSWADVLNICQQLPQLYWLNISENLLELPEEINDVYPNISVFICGNMNLTWTDIKRLSKIFPNINELRANNNYITDLTTEDKNNFNNLEILDLEENPIKDWDEVRKLKTIKSLQNLSLDGTGLESINFKTKEQTLDYFLNLSKLCISNNLISDWLSLSELNKLPNLEELKFINCPILKSENAETASAIVIAKIRSLKIYNGRIINHEDRRGSELDYMKKYGLEWLRVKNTPDQVKFLEEHNRYLELIKEYGELEAGELQIPDTTLKNALINLNLVYNEQTVIKKISPAMLVQKLKILVRRLFKLDDFPELVCITEEGRYEIPLDDDTKEISYFSVNDNDTIIVKPATN
ncbi:tubulin-specific chaperone E [Sitophilus oryzae]|uniref:Tubulin-specific chaperone E n=1 Tax=Sitophilus oryzae TaxID=7048 RepID=A0A6J2YS04_SITOR|nr:tubulin-specific chaperone E [Sitophilus oryzae]